MKKVSKKFECDKCNTINFRNYEVDEEPYCKKCKDREEAASGIQVIKRGDGWADK